MNIRIAKAVLLFVSCAVISSCLNEPEETGPKYHSVRASLDDGTRTLLTEREGSYNLYTRWQGHEYIKVFCQNVDGYNASVPTVQIEKVTPDGTGATFSYKVPEEWEEGETYTVKMFTTTCLPVVHEGKLYYNASIIREPIGEFMVPVYYEGEVGGDGEVNAVFHHYYTYELLHIKNTSDSDIEFSLSGFSASPTWFKTKGSFCIDDGQFVVDAPSTKEPVMSSSPITVKPGQSEIIVSAYIPNGQKIHDARMVASINGQTVNSSNTKSSEATLLQGHAYHMFASWDGNELVFNDGPTATIEIQPEEIDFGQVDYGADKTQAFTVSNIGRGDLSFSVLYKSHEDVFEVSDSGKVFTLAYGESREFAVTAHGTQRGRKDECTIMVISNADNGDRSVTVRSEGFDTMPITFEADTVNMDIDGEVIVRILQGSMEYSLENDNPEAVSAEIETETAVTDSTYYKSSQTSQMIHLSALSEGTARLRVFDAGGDEGTLVVNVKEVVKPVIEVSPAEIDFGKVVVGNSVSYSSTVTNNGPGILKFSVEGGDGVFTCDIPEEVSLDEGQSQVLPITFSPSDAVEVNASLQIVSNAANGTQVISCTGIGVNPVVLPDEAVDLGLSVMWSSCNLGASSPEQYGNYYAWGEVEPKDEYSWATYKWADGSSSSITKYLDVSSSYFIDLAGAPTLEIEDDAANYSKGGNWRMPSMRECGELTSGCTWTKSTQKGVDGYIVTGPNGNSIFLPMAGAMYSLGYWGGAGHYLSSSIEGGSKGYAWNIEVDNSYVSISSIDRSIGASIRPVWQHPEAHIQMTSVRRNFDSVELGKKRSAEILVFNIGDSPLTILSIDTPDGFSHSLQEKCPITISPGKYRTTFVYFEPSRVGDYSGEVIIESDDPVHPRVSIKVSGKCVEPPVPEGNIKFADPLVESICVSNWDTNKDGALSYAEAAAVQKLDWVFWHQDKISSFDELEYFIGLPSMGEYEFAECTNLSSVTIPRNAKSIDYQAFVMSGLKGIKIPEGITIVNTEAFCCCSNLEWVSFPSTLTITGIESFSYSGLRSVTIPGTLKTVGEKSFMDCKQLTELVIENGVEVIDYNAFDGTAIRYVKIPSSVKKLLDYAFSCCYDLTTVEFEDRLISLSSGVFGNCKSLVNVSLPSTLMYVGWRSFQYCTSLKSIRFPEKVKWFGEQCFWGSDALNTVIIENPDTVPEIKTTSFPWSNKGFKVYVPDSMMDSYKTSPIWEDHTDCLAPMSSLQ